MYHYLFTNDLRISLLDTSLQHAGQCFVTGTVPLPTVDKSANNNMKTLGFYFNLTADSVCTKEAAKGNIREVVYNFIKKFQFPNPRTTESQNNSTVDGITLAPMRVIIKLLYTMNLLYGESTAYLTRDEIKYFVFYNDAVAKTTRIDFIQLVTDINSYRSNNTYPVYISTNDADHEWNHEARQIREMISILKWSGCVAEVDDKIILSNDHLSKENKAAIYDIINYDKFWTGSTIESYREYMDMDISMSDGIQTSIDIFARRTGGTNILYYGVPGSGKSYAISQICSDERYMERVVFHPDYTYSDFVGQILPQLREGTGLEYVFTAGPFTRVLQKAQNDPDNMYYLIIEEINRGNAPAIFGEIFQLLDRNADGTSEYGISNYEVASEVYGDSSHPVRLLSNLTILATMNTSDQNVFTLDTAFQRRWRMQHIPNSFNNPHADDIIQGTSIRWGAFAEVINEMVLDANSDLAGSSDKRLGAYFARTRDLNSDVFPEKVLKYLWDDVFRMDKELVFDEQYKAIDNVIETYESAESDKLKAVLKSSVYNRMAEKSAASNNTETKEQSNVSQD